ncbi:MAG: alpha/beta hydrolase [Leptospiraceae bacterium]|nr:alpha/beta hydrolase [Leptospiraceae bacterium]MDW8306619.1 alpha/beta hydrolase [Leptospiraceae bacterium]
MAFPPKSKKILTTVAVIASLLIFLYLGIGYHFSQVILSPKRTALEAERIKLKLPPLHEIGFGVKEEIEFQSDGVWHWGWYFPGKSSRCGLVAHHGLTSNRWGVIPYVRHFQRCHILVYDARAHGESGDAFVTYGYYEKNALAKAIEILQQKSGLNKGSIGLLGESLGATTVLLFAAENSGYAFVIADSPYYSVEKIIEERAIKLHGKLIKTLFFPIARFFSEFLGKFRFEDVNLENKAANIRDPVLLVHAAKDDHTLAYHSQKIFENLPEGKKDLFLTDWTSLHARSVHQNPEKYIMHVKSFISRYAPEYPALW